MTVRPRFGWGLILLVILGLISHTSVFGQVTGFGIVPTPLYVAGQNSSTMYYLASSNNADGINGEIQFDQNQLSNPNVTPGLGATGYVAQGYEYLPGRYRFVLYPDPPNVSLNLAQPVINFTFEPNPNLVGSARGTVKMLFGEAARAMISPPNSVISVRIGGPSATPPAANVTLADFSYSIMGRPLITIHPASQTIKAGQDVRLTADATGLGQPFTYGWADDTGEIPGATTNELLMTDVQTDAAGNYVCGVVNAADLSLTNVAVLTVLPSNTANDAIYQSNSIPVKMLPGQTLLVDIAFKNTSLLSWSLAQNYALAVVGDPNGIFDTNRLPIPDPHTIVAPNTRITFNAAITAPNNPGVYDFTLQMVEEGVGFFGEIKQLSLNVEAHANDADEWMEYN